MINHIRAVSNSDFIAEIVTYPSNLHMPLHQDKLSCITIILSGSINETFVDPLYQRNANVIRGSILIKPNNAVHENQFGKLPVNLLSIRFNNDHLFKEYFQKWRHVNNHFAYNNAVSFWLNIRNAKTDRQLRNSLHRFSTAVSIENENDLNAACWLSQFKKLLSDNFDQEIRISEIANKLSLHRVYIGRVFKKRYDISPVEYRKHVRIAAVFCEIITSNKSLAAIALDAGFSDQSHMSREFKKTTNCTPASVNRLVNNSIQDM